MYYDSKHLITYTGEPAMEYPPKVYFDCYYLPQNLKLSWRSNKQIVTTFGLFGFYFCMNLNWAFVERERNDFEEQIYQGTQSFIERFDETE